LDWFRVYAIDVLSGYRGMFRRFGKHRLMALWFVVLMLAFVGIVLEAIHLIRHGSLSEALTLDDRTVYMFAFFALLGKTVAETQFRIIKAPELVHLFSLSIRPSSLVAGKVVRVVMFNLLLLALGLGIGAMEYIILPVDIPLNPWVFLSVIVLTILASFLGFSFVVFNSLRKLKKRVSLMFSIILPVFVFYYLITYTKLAHQTMFYAFVATMLIGILPLLVANRYFLEAWNAANAPDAGRVRSVYKRGSLLMRWATRWLDPLTDTLVEREIAEKMRSREFVGTVITVVAVAGGIVWSTGGVENIEFPSWMITWFFEPSLIGIGVFIGALLEPGMSALSSVGKEGKKIWILKTSPLPGRTITRSMGVANLIAMPFLVVSMGVFVPLYLGYGLRAVVFTAFSVLALCMTYVGIGLWMGAKYPSFDSAFRGTPDIVTIYLFAMVCLAIGGVLMGIPYAIYITDNVLGILAMVLAADMGLAFMLFGMERSGKAFDRMEPAV